MTYEDLSRRLNKCSYLYLDHLGHTDCEHHLKVEVVEARAQEERQIQTGNADLDKIFGKGRSIETRPEYDHFTLIFEDYIAYSVRDESFAQPEESEEYSKKLRTYEKSSFRDYVEASTHASNDHPGPLKHFAVVCENHVIDVICLAEPSITLRAIGQQT